MEKLADARRYQAEEQIAWPVLVDDLEGTVQHALGGLSASAYLVDAQGCVAFYALWGQAPPLRRAIDDLLARGGIGRAGKSIDRVPHLAAAIVAGQGGPARGGRTSFIDLELGFPGAALLMSVGWLARPLLKPLVLSTTPARARAGALLLTGLSAGAAALIFKVARSGHARSSIRRTEQSGLRLRDNYRCLSRRAAR